MSQDLILHRAVSVVVIASLVISMSAATAFADPEETHQLRLHKGFLKPLRFTHGPGGYKKIFCSAGLRFTPEFEETVSDYPPALREARKAFAYNGMALAGSAVMLVLSLKSLLGTVEKARSLSRGQFVGSTFELGHLVSLGVAGAVAIAGSRLSYSHLNRSVQMFNTRSTVLNEKGRPHRGGLRVGLNVSDIGGENPERTGSMKGLNIGGFLTRPLSDKFSMQFEIGLTQKGYTSRLQHPTRYTRLTYLEIPVLLGYTPKSTGFQPVIYTGPALGIKLQVTYELEGRKTTPETEDREADDWKATDIGWVVGTGTRLGSTPWTADLRYTTGLTSAYESDMAYYQRGPMEVKHTVWSLNVGYCF